ncbi:hypothetical protein [Cellulomonas sp. HZM]|uniref:hypothetical protein n=1 Tax=Cellulomonas sp. HZM TaxID=1454010 RepID=UPI00049381FB|nr:hypothetical protein [Cellulomonas sp. HZM]
MTVTQEHEVRRRPALHAVQAVRLGDAPRVSLVRELEDLVERLHLHGASTRLRAELDDLLSAWAKALVDLHRGAVTAQVDDAPLPWVLEQPFPAWLDELPAQAGPAWAVRANAAVARYVETAARQWTAVQATHGDVTGDLVVVVRDAGRVDAWIRPPADGSPTGRLGDPRWDVACALDWLAVGLVPALDPAWHLDPAAVLVARYRDAGGSAMPTRGMAVARTLATAVEWTAQLAVLSEPDDEDLAWLAGLWSRPLELVRGAVRVGRDVAGDAR